MRKLFMAVILTVLQLSMHLSAQEKLDTLIFSSGKTEAVIIRTNYQDRIEYCYPGEDMLNVLDKSQLTEIRFRSGRKESLASQPVKTASLKDAAMIKRMEQLDKDSEGSKKALKGIKRISLSVVMSGEVRALIDDYENVSKNCPYVFSAGAQCDGIFIPGTASKDCYAVLYLVKADSDDGEVYGYLEYYMEGNEASVYSFYVNGNGLKPNSPFDEQFLSAVYDAGMRSLYRVFKPR